MKARLAKKLLRNLTVMHLEPGDVLVVRTPDLVPPSVSEQVREEVKRFFPGHEVLVVAGWELSAVRPVPRFVLQLVGRNGVEAVIPAEMADRVRATLDVPPSGGEE